jgi:hypothetical protein
LLLGKEIGVFGQRLDLWISPCSPSMLRKGSDCFDWPPGTSVSHPDNAIYLPAYVVVGALLVLALVKFRAWNY